MEETVDRNEAKLLLQACRPDGQDDDLPVFAEALALVERDPELKAWWEARRKFDRAVFAQVRQVKPPADLRATILAGRKIEQMTPRYHLPYWLAAAAIIAICAGLGALTMISGSKTVAVQVPAGSMGNQDFQSGVEAFLEDDNSSIAMMSRNHDRVAAWLQEQHSPLGKIPTKMENMPTIGCQTFMVHGHPVSLICFTLSSGEVAHLFMVEKQALADPPGSSPSFLQAGAWSLANWSDGVHTYMLATKAGEDRLKQLL
jgi:hypothetical protein